MDSEEINPLEPYEAKTLAEGTEPNGQYYGPLPNYTRNPQPRPFFKSVEWSADGTCLFALSSSNFITSYVVPQDLLEHRDEPLEIQAQSTLAMGEATAAIAPNPNFALSDPSTHMLLATCTDQPIQLYRALPTPGQPCPPYPPVISSYPVRTHNSEVWPKVMALCWAAPGTHFFAGTKNLIVKIDVEHETKSPQYINTAGGKYDADQHMSMRGVVSALSVLSGFRGIVAAGTLSRRIGLYDTSQKRSCFSTWDLAGATKYLPNPDGRQYSVEGLGVMQTVFSPCKMYMIVNERRSNGLLVYDVRNTMRLLACLVGRESKTNQRLSCDVFQAPGSSSFEVWGGTDDGTVKVWDKVGMQEGFVDPSWAWKGHGTGVGSVCVHGTGEVLASCSGSWEIVTPSVPMISNTGPDDSEEEQSEDPSDSESGGPKDDDGPDTMDVDLDESASGEPVTQMSAKTIPDSGEAIPGESIAHRPSSYKPPTCEAVSDDETYSHEPASAAPVAEVPASAEVRPQEPGPGETSTRQHGSYKPPTCESVCSENGSGEPSPDKGASSHESVTGEPGPSRPRPTTFAHAPPVLGEVIYPSVVVRETSLKIWSVKATRSLDYGDAMMA